MVANQISRDWHRWKTNRKEKKQFNGWRIPRELAAAGLFNSREQDNLKKPHPPTLGRAAPEMCCRSLTEPSAMCQPPLCLDPRRQTTSRGAALCGMWWPQCQGSGRQRFAACGSNCTRPPVGAFAVVRFSAPSATPVSRCRVIGECLDDKRGARHSWRLRRWPAVPTTNKSKDSKKKNEGLSVKACDIFMGSLWDSPIKI